MKEKVLLTTTFLPRKVILLSEIPEEPDLTCMQCGKRTKLVINGEVKTTCNHEEQCAECRDYQIEKCFRCSDCCNFLLGFVPPFCCNDCKRQKLTQKRNAICTVCDSHLQRECKACKSSSHFAAAKQLFKKKLFVLVQSPQYVGASQRPCSHYALCKQCKHQVARGHKGKSLCKSCRQDNAITISSFTPMASSISRKEELTESVNEPRREVCMTVEYAYPMKSYSAFSGHSVLSVTNKYRKKNCMNQGIHFGNIPKEKTQSRSTFLGVGEEYIANTPTKSISYSFPTLPSFESLLTCKSTPLQRQRVKLPPSPPPQGSPIRVDENMYNVCTNKIW